jgi:hypothetical protein
MALIWKHTIEVFDGDEQGIVIRRNPFPCIIKEDGILLQ